MKIAFLITAKGHGRGGHFYSLRSTAESLAEHTEVAIINVGPSRSPVLDGASIQVVNIPYDGEMEGQCAKLLNWACVETPSVLHAFDLESLYFGRHLSRRLQLPLVYTKCGGPNPRWYFPRVSNLIVYSSENFRYFSSKGRKRFRTLVHIPNRVHKPKQHLVRIAELRKRLKPNELVFLRVSRVARYYRLSLMQAASLVRRLNEDGVAARLLIIGAIQDADIVHEINEASGGAAIVSGEDRYTTDAAELIDVADFVIGTGRGFMEAAICGKVVLCPVANLGIPVIASERTIGNFFSSNFSERCESIGTSEAEEYAAIKALCMSSPLRRKVATFVERFAVENFAMCTAVPKYLELYRNMVFDKKWAPLDLLLHRSVVAKSLRGSTRALAGASLVDR